MKCTTQPLVRASEKGTVFSTSEKPIRPADEVRRELARLAREKLPVFSTREELRRRANGSGE